jgi:hypothetical protein
MGRILLYLASVLLAAAPEGAWAEGSSFITASEVAEASTLATSWSVPGPRGRSFGSTMTGDVSITLEMEEVGSSQSASVTLCVSTLLEVGGQPDGANLAGRASSEPAVRVSLTPNPRVTVLTFFPMAPMWLMREAYIESERAFDQLQRAVDLPLWREWDLPGSEHIDAPPPQTIREEAGFANPQAAINQNCACADPVGTYGEGF